MTRARESMEPQNLAGQEHYRIESIQVLEFHPLEDGKGDPTEVHLWLVIEGAEDTPFVMEFHSPGAIDELIVALMTHRNRVFGYQPLAKPEGDAKPPPATPFKRAGL